jgi:DNA-binding transcriptional MerR regulator
MRRTAEDAKRLAEKLNALPPMENKQRLLTKQQEIKLLAGEIRALQQRNYPLDQIAKILTDEGVSITCNTLRNYLQRAVAAKQPTSKRKAQPASTTKDNGKQAEAGSTKKQLAGTMGERAAASVAQAAANPVSAAVAILRPDRPSI